MEILRAVAFRRNEEMTGSGVCKLTLNHQQKACRTGFYCLMAAEDHSKLMFLVKPLFSFHERPEEFTALRYSSHRIRLEEQNTQQSAALRSEDHGVAIRTR